MSCMRRDRRVILERDGEGKSHLPGGSSSGFKRVQADSASISVFLGESNHSRQRIQIKSIINFVEWLEWPKLSIKFPIKSLILIPSLDSPSTSPSPVRLIQVSLLVKGWPKNKKATNLSRLYKYLSQNLVTYRKIFQLDLVLSQHFEWTALC